MRLLRPILLILSCLLFWQTAKAQWLTADDYFNNGAHSYLTNNIPQALQSVETGLRRYPDDEKLKKLEELLKQQQKQQQQQQKQQQNQQDQKNQQQQNQKNQQNQNQQNQNQQNQSQQNQQQQNQQNQQQQNQGQDKQNQGQKNQPKPDQQNQANQDQNGQNGTETNADAQAMGAARMTPEEAKRLLDQQKNDEQVLVMKPQAKPPDQDHPIKDW
jgi:hypothetical protein